MLEEDKGKTIGIRFCLAVGMFLAICLAVSLLPIG